MTTRTTNTPFGSIAAQYRDGRWYVAQDFSRVSHSCDQEIKAMVQGYASAFRTQHTLFAKAIRIDQTRRRCMFELPVIPDLLPLSAHRMPLQSTLVREIILKIAAGLEVLHSKGFGAWCIAPESVFYESGSKTLALVPTPWLGVATLSGSDFQYQDSSTSPLMLAPELLRSETVGSADSALRADIFCLGHVAWSLLTGVPRTSPHQLPSAVSPQFAQWDRFIDGCSKTNLDRRFATLSGALSEVPGCNHEMPPPGQNQADRKAIRSLKRPQTSLPWIIAVVALFCGALILSGQNWLRLQLPGLSPYTRGFADTIIRYKDRSYEGVAWKKVQSARAMQSVIAGSGKVSGLEFKGIAGWDKDNYWVVSAGYPAGAYFCSFTGGHWKLRGATDLAKRSNVIDSVWRPRLIAEEECIWVNRSQIIKLNSRGTTLLADDDYGQGGLLCPVADDLFFVFCPYDDSYRVSGDTVEEISRSKHKESFLHGEDNTPLRNCPISGLRYTMSYHPGHAIGLYVPFSDPEDDPPMVAEYRNGLWYRVADVQGIMDYQETRHAWFGGAKNGGPEFVVVVGTLGRVVFCSFDGSSIVQTVRADQAPTSLDLLRVWGVNESKYWVMDSNGTVWQRENGEWVVVVRGLYENDVEFEAAWVSPDGVIVAASDQDIYRLE